MAVGVGVGGEVEVEVTSTGLLEEMTMETQYHGAEKPEEPRCKTGANIIAGNIIHYRCQPVPSPPPLCSHVAKLRTLQQILLPDPAVATVVVVAVAVAVGTVAGGATTLLFLQLT